MCFLLPKSPNSEILKGGAPRPRKFDFSEGRFCDRFSLLNPYSKNNCSAKSPKSEIPNEGAPQGRADSSRQPQTTTSYNCCLWFSAAVSASAAVCAPVSVYISPYLAISVCFRPQPATTDRSQTMNTSIAVQQNLLYQLT